MTQAPRMLGGRYEVGELLGRGGMAEVHRGFDTRLRRPVAIKLLRLDLVRDTTFLSRFRREAQSAAGLSMPHIVAVYDSGEDTVTEGGGASVALPYIVMELVEGQSLRQMLTATGALPAREATRIMIDVLEALAHSHQTGIIHRDIKPANVMVSRSGTVKVMDFGIARAIADAQATMTQTSSVIGTAQYFSPEQAQGQAVDSRSDLYSAGCMLFELLTGRPPFVGDSPLAIAYQHVGETAPRPSSINPQVPPVLDMIVARALEKDLGARYQTAAEFRDDLIAARDGRPLSDRTEIVAGGAAGGVAGAGAAAMTEPVPSPDGRNRRAAAAASSAATAVVPTAVVTPAGPPEDGRRRGWLVALLSLVAVAALAVVGYLALSSLNKPAPQPTTVSVPSLKDKTKTEAESLLRDKGLTMKPEYQSDRDVPKDNVIRQNPVAGASVAVGSPVTVVISTGRDLMTLVDLKGMKKDEVTKVLADAKFTLPPVFVYTDEPKVAKDIVVSQNPLPGDVERSTQITVTLASGNVKVPSYIGRYEAVAQVELSQLGLKPVSTDVISTDQPAGTVIGQDIKDVAVPNGSTITLKVARRPNPTVTTTVFTSSPPPTTSPTTPATPPPTTPATPQPVSTADITPLPKP